MTSRIQFAATLAAAAIAVSCSSDSVTAPDPATATYASSLGINLSAMTKTSTGLYYQDVPAGTGATAASGNQVTVQYTGYLTNGTTFDTSIGKPPFVFTLGVGQVIAGWDQGVAGMRVGGTRKLVIPPSLGYGSSAYGPIPANSILVFNVQLISIP